METRRGESPRCRWRCNSLLYKCTAFFSRGGDFIANDLVGRQFGRWVVIDKAPKKNGRTAYLCRCSCGTEKEVRASTLISGDSTSCGCLQRELVGSRAKKHGGFGSRLYHIWDSMRQRCLNKSSRAYKNYGARGIKICESWQEFDAFRAWAYANGYYDDAPRGSYTLDRIDVDGDYSPENCRWVDMKTQSRNKRDTIYLEVNGVLRTLSEWAEMYGLRYDTIWRRYKSGKTPDEILAPI